MRAGRCGRLVVSALLHMMVLVGLTGCPPPDQNLVFESSRGSGFGQRIDLFDKSMRVDLLSKTWFGYPVRDRYQLQLSLRIRSHKDLAGDMYADPKALVVLFEDTPMELVRCYVNSTSDTLTVRDYKIRMHFELEQPRLDAVNLDRLRDPTGAEVRFVLDRFLLRNGEPLPIDTVLAIDRKAVHWEYELMRSR